MEIRAAEIKRLELPLQIVMSVMSAEIRAAAIREPGFPFQKAMDAISVEIGSVQIKEAGFQPAEALRRWQSAKTKWRKTVSTEFPLEQEAGILLLITARFLKTANMESIFPNALT